MRHFLCCKSRGQEKRASALFNRGRWQRAAAWLCQTHSRVPAADEARNWQISSGYDQIICIVLPIRDR